jgi:hypothetical protein
MSKHSNIVDLLLARNARIALILGKEARAFAEERKKAIESI